MINSQYTSRMTRSSTLLVAGLLAALAVGLATGETHAQCLVAELDPGVPGGRFGDAVDMDGTTLVVGAPFENNKRGAVYIYERVGNGWVLDDKIDWADSGFAGFDLSAIARFGSDVAIDGSRIVVGAERALRDDGSGERPGAAGVYAKVGGVWAIEDSFSSSGDGVYYGAAVDIHNDLVIVGIPRWNQSRGSAGVYKRNGSGNWSRQIWLDNTGFPVISSVLQPSDQFGFSVAVTQRAGYDWAIVGMPYRDIISAGQGSAGAMHVFADLGGNSWGVWTGEVPAPTPHSAAYFGWSLDFHIVDSEEFPAALIGAPGESPGGSIFNLRGDFGYHQELTAAGSARVGASIAVDGNVAIAGDIAYGNDGQAALWNYSESLGAWFITTTVESPTLTSQAEFGFDVAITDNGDTFAVGAPGASNETGRVLVYLLNDTDTDGDGAIDACDNCPVDANADQADGDADGVGNVCDNCPDDANAGQGDSDGDGVGNVCDTCPNDDVSQSDMDNDGVGDFCDGCPTAADAGQADADADGIGDACEGQFCVTFDDVNSCRFPVLVENPGALAEANVTGAPDAQFAALGDNQVTYAFTCGVIANGPGSDLNLYHWTQTPPTFSLIDVLVSQDGVNFISVTASAIEGGTSLAGVSRDDDNTVRGYDLSEAGLAWARFLRIQGTDDGSGGFDLDAVAAVFMSCTGLGNRLLPPGTATYANVDPPMSTVSPSTGAFYYANVPGVSGGALFANEPGIVTVTWRDASGTQLGVPSAFPVSPIPTTDLDFDGDEVDDIAAVATDYFLDYPSANVAVTSPFTLTIRYNDTLRDHASDDPVAYPFPDIDVGPGGIVTTQSYTPTGFVIFQYTDGPAGALLGFEILRIDNFGSPTASVVRIGRPIPAPAGTDCRAKLLQNGTAQDHVAWQLGVDGPEIYPIRPEMFAANLQIAWYAGTPFQNCWPKMVTRHVSLWPSDPQTHVVVANQTPPAEGSKVPIPGNYCGAEVMYQEGFSAGEYPFGSITAMEFSATAPGYSVVRFDSIPNVPNAQCGDAVNFEVIATYDHLDNITVLPDSSTVLHATTTGWEIGTQILEADCAQGAGNVCHDPSATKYPHGYLHSGKAHNEAVFNDTGQVIPVNVSSVFGDTQMWWFQEGQYAPGIYWPHKVRSYGTAWPATTATIDIAAQLGAGAYPIDPDTKIYEAGHLSDVDGDLSDVTTIGWNPNDEHAQLYSDGADLIAYAVRDDNPWGLPAPLGNDPYVLVQYRDVVDGLWRMGVHRVGAISDFDYAAYLTEVGTAGLPVEAGQPILPMFPVNFRSLGGSAIALSPDDPCFASTIITGDALWQDRKGTYWAVEETDDQTGATTSATIQLYERWIPLGTGPDDDGSGGCSPWRDFGSNGPTPVTYRPQWPAEPDRVLRVGQVINMEDFCGPLTTLHDSVGIRIIDPTFEVSVMLDELPGEVNLKNLPPHLVAGEIGGGGDVLDDRIQHEFGELFFIGIMSQRDRDLIKSLDNDSDASGPDACNSDFCLAVNTLFALSQAQIDVPLTTPVRKFVSLADVDAEPGYVTLATQDVVGPGSSCLDGDPVEVEVWSVDCPPVAGEITPIQPTCPFNEKLVLQHTIDGGGRPENLSYQWQVCDRIDCTDQEWVDALLPTEFADGLGLREIIIAGSSPFTLADSYWRVRYRGYAGCGCTEGVDCNEQGIGWPFPSDGTQNTMISDWSLPQLAEGWIKRLVRGLTPFDQRIEAFRTTAVATYVDMIRQAGIRYEEPVALNCNAEVINDLGLIAAYETAQRRAQEFSIDIGIDLANANQAIMLVAGKIVDLYMLLGNESFTDANDPTIGLFDDPGVPGGSPTYSPSSVFSFQGQADVPTMLAEELALLRGLDDSVPPSVFDGRIVATRYNRLPWNFTSTDGAVAYANNYQVTALTDPNPNCGELGEAPCNGARDLYPQGHGDAWGHYLTAVKKYYALMQHPVFTWVVGTESVLVDGDPVEVGFEHERRFAKAAAAAARTGAAITALTFRERYDASPTAQDGYPDTDHDRGWGVSEWGRRAGAGAYLNWVTANALLDDNDDDPSHAGTLRKVDRTTVTEVGEIAQAINEIQSTLDNADAGLNPLGLATNVVPFGLSGVSPTSTHFDQMYDRAIAALGNVAAAFDYANEVTRRLRADEASVGAFQNQVAEREQDYTNRLIEYFGRPYNEDVGPGLTYSPAECPNGQCPDFLHFPYIDDVAGLLGNDALGGTTTITATFRDVTANSNSGTTSTTTRTVDFNVSVNGLGMQKPTGWGLRPEPGEIQLARSEALLARTRFLQGLARYEEQVDKIQAQADLLEQLHGLNDNILQVLTCSFDSENPNVTCDSDSAADLKTLHGRIRSCRRAQLYLRQAANYTVKIGEAFAEGIPKFTIAGFSVGGDLFAPARGGLIAGTLSLGAALDIGANIAEVQELKNEQLIAESDAQSEIDIIGWQGDVRVATEVARLREIIAGEPPLRLEVLILLEEANQAAGRYQAAVGKGLRLLKERTHFRARTATQVSQYRYRDMAYRIFRNEALQKYRAMFDLAARYVFLTAKVYDYETNLLGGESQAGQQFLTGIVKERLVGRVDAGQPLSGNGLSGQMHDLRANFDSLTGVGGGLQYQDFSTRTFSLRRGAFGLSAEAVDDDAWRQVLIDAMVPDLQDLPEYRRIAALISPSISCGSSYDGSRNPALVLRFNTSIISGQNFFGFPLQGGKDTFNSAFSSVKLREVGVRFADYPVDGGGFALGNTPGVYLLPIGTDVMRVPQSCSSIEIPPTRRWTLLDQTLPMPFPIGETELSGADWQPWDDLTGGAAGLVSRRRYLPVTARDESVPDSVDLSNVLLGRTAWNTEWMLIIPGSELLGCPEEGLDILINGVDDQGGIQDIDLILNAYGFGGCTAGRALPSVDGGTGQDSLRKQ